MEKLWGAGRSERGNEWGMRSKFRKCTCVFELTAVSHKASAAQPGKINEHNAI